MLHYWLLLLAWPDPAQGLPHFCPGSSLDVVCCSLLAEGWVSTSQALGGLTGGTKVEPVELLSVKQCVALCRVSRSTPYKPIFD